MLGPAVISFGLQLYQYREMLSQNLRRVLTTTFISSAIGIGSSVALVKLVRLSPLECALAPLTRCITTPLALSGAQLTGADPSITAIMVVFTGILGASFSERILSLVCVSDPVSVGLSVGGAAHGLGAASVAYDPVKFASAVVSMTLTGFWTVLFLAQKGFRNNLINFMTF